MQILHKGHFLNTCLFIFVQKNETPYDIFTLASPSPGIHASVSRQNLDIFLWAFYFLLLPQETNIHWASQGSTDLGWCRCFCQYDEMQQLWIISDHLTNDIFRWWCPLNRPVSQDWNWRHVPWNFHIRMLWIRLNWMLGLFFNGWTSQKWLAHGKKM